VLNALGANTSLVVRRQKALQEADQLDEEMQKQGIKIFRRNTTVLGASRVMD